MKLTKKDKELLKSWGHPDEDFEQIERAAGKTKYEHYTLTTVERISMKKAIELLGRKEFLSGLSRSSFHYTAERNVPNSEDKVSFDSYALFNDW